MDLDLSGRVALVTGSSHGIGKAIAHALVVKGACVLLTGRDVIRLLETITEIRTEIRALHLQNVDVYGLKMDAIKMDEIKQIFTKLPYSHIDILVNNVGGPLKFGKFEDLSDDDWLADWNFNFMSMVRFTRAAIPFLKESGNGRIINISAVPARQPGVYIPQYAASKAAMLNLSKYLANDLAKYNILVNSICPGTLEGGLWDANVADRASRDGISKEGAADKMIAEEFKKTPLQRMGTPEDVADLVAFLASDKAKHITGTVINVDGGTVRSMI